MQRSLDTFALKVFALFSFQTTSSTWKYIWLGLHTQKIWFILKGTFLPSFANKCIPLFLLQLLVFWQFRFFPREVIGRLSALSCFVLQPHAQSTTFLIAHKTFSNDQRSLEHGHFVQQERSCEPSNSAPAPRPHESAIIEMFLCARPRWPLA